jgi:glycosyltransferase involved in cell wall biosynthesis
LNILVSIADDGGAWHPDIILATLLELGHEVTFLGWKRTSARAGTTRCRKYLLALPTGYASYKVALGLPFWLTYATVRMMFARTEAIHAMDLEAGFPAAISSIFTGRPFVYQVLDRYDLRHQWPTWFARLFRAAERWTMARATWIFVADDDRISDLERPFAEKLGVIYNSAPSLPRATREMRRDRTTMLVTGLLLKNRGVGDLLEAIRNVPDMRIIAAGQVPESDLLKQIRNHPQVDYRGELPPSEANRLYAESDCVLCFYDPRVPGYRAASSTKMFAAMAAGVPVLVNSEQAKTGFVIGKNFGYTAPYGDVASMATTLHAIAADPDRAEKGKRGQRLEREQFSWEIMRQRIADVYRDRIVGSQR